MRNCIRKGLALVAIVTFTWTSTVQAAPLVHSQNYLRAQSLALGSTTAEGLRIDLKASSGGEVVSTEAVTNSINYKALLNIYGDSKNLNRAISDAVEATRLNEDEIIQGMFSLNEQNIVQSTKSFIERLRSPPSGEQALAIGGGTALLVTSKALSSAGYLVKIIQSSVDDGGSTFNLVYGLVEHSYGRIPSPGDIVAGLFKGFAAADKLFKLLDDQGRIALYDDEYKKFKKNKSLNKIQLIDSEKTGDIAVYNNTGDIVDRVNSLEELVTILLHNIVRDANVRKLGYTTDEMKINADKGLGGDFVFFAATVLNIARIIDENYFKLNSSDNPIVPLGGASIRNLMLLGALDYLGVLKTNKTAAEKWAAAIETEEDKEFFQLALDALAASAGIKTAQVMLSHYKPATVYAKYDANVILIKEGVDESGKDVMHAITAKVNSENMIDVIVNDEQEPIIKSLKKGENGQFIIASQSGGIKVKFKNDDGLISFSVAGSEFCKIEESAKGPEESYVIYSKNTQGDPIKQVIAQDGTGRVKYGFGAGVERVKDEFFPDEINDVKVDLNREQLPCYAPLKMGGMNVYVRSRFVAMQTNITETPTFSYLSKIIDFGNTSPNSIKSEEKVYEIAKKKVQAKYYYEPDLTQGLEPNQGFIDAILSGDTKMIVLGPGSFFTSIMPHLMVNDVVKTLIKRCAKNDIPIVFIANPNVDNETVGYDLKDIIGFIEKVASTSMSRKVKFGEIFNDLEINDFDTVKLHKYLHGTDAKDGSIPPIITGGNCLIVLKKHPELIKNLNLEYVKYLLDRFFERATINYSGENFSAEIHAQRVLSAPSDKEERYVWALSNEKFLDTKFNILNDDDKPLLNEHGHEISGGVTLDKYIELKLHELQKTLYETPNPEIRTDAGAGSKEAKKSRGPIFYTENDITALKQNNPGMVIRTDDSVAGVGMTSPRAPGASLSPHIGFIQPLYNKIIEEIAKTKEPLNLSNVSDSSSMFPKSSSAGDAFNKIPDGKIYSKEDKNNAIYWIKEGLAFSARGDAESAEKAYTSSIEACPDFAEAYYLRGNARRRLGLNKEALTDFKKSVNLNPNDANTWFNLGKTYKDLGMLYEAVDCFSMVANLEPGAADSWYMLGNIRMAQGVYKEAIMAYRQALKVKSNFVSARVNLKAVMKYIEQDAVQVTIMLIRDKLEKGDMEEAMAIAYKLSEDNPYSALAYSNLGFVYGYCDLKGYSMLAESVKAYRKAIELDPNLAIIHGYLGIQLSKLNMLDEAQQEYENAIKLAKDLNEIPSAMLNLGAIYRHQGRPLAAIRVWLKMLEEISPYCIDAKKARITLASVGSLILMQLSLEKDAIAFIIMDESVQQEEPLTEVEIAAVKTIIEEVEHDGIKTSSSGISLADRNVENIRLAFEPANLSDATGTIAYNDTTLSLKQQQMLQSLIGTDTQGLKELEEGKELPGVYALSDRQKVDTKTSSAGLRITDRTAIEKVLKDTRPKVILGLLRDASKLSPEEAAASENPFAGIGFDPGLNRMMLGWIPERIKQLIDKPALIDMMIGTVNILKKTGKKNFMFTGIGGSGLGVGTIVDTYGQPPQDGKIYTLTTPSRDQQNAVILDLRQRYEGNLKKALEESVLFAISKSGSTAETREQAEFFESLYRANGIDPKEHIFFITDSDTKDKPVEKNAFAERIYQGYGQLPIQFDGQNDIGGRFTSPTTMISLLPLALINTKLVKPYLENAYAMVKIKDTDDIILKQVFISLGVFLDMISNAKYPRTFNKLTLLLPEELKAFAPWVVQLIHESLGKNGKGIEVLFGEELTPDMADDFIRQGRVFLRVNLADKAVTEPNLWQAIKNADIPTFEMTVKGKENLGGLQAGFQLTTATIAYLSDIHFVIQPAVEKHKNATRDVMSTIGDGEALKLPEIITGSEIGSKSGKLSVYFYPLVQAGVITFAEIEKEVARLNSDMANTIAVFAAILNLVEGLDRFEQVQLGLFGTMSEKTKKAFARIRKEVFTKKNIPSIIATWPDDLHANEQDMADGLGREITFVTAVYPTDAAEIPGGEAVNIKMQNQLAAPFIGLMNSKVESKGMICGIAYEGMQDEASDVLERFFEKVNTLRILSKSSSSGVSLTDKDLKNINLAAEIANLSDAIGTIAYNDRVLSLKQQQMLQSLMGAGTQGLAELEQKLGCSVRLMSQGDIEDNAKTIIISTEKLAGFTNVKYFITEQTQIDTSYIAITPLIAIAKGLLGLESKTVQPRLYAALKSSIRSLSQGLLNENDIDDAITAYINGNPMFIKLPPAVVYNYDQLEQLYRQALMVLIAA